MIKWNQQGLLKFMPILKDHNKSLLINPKLPSQSKFKIKRE